MSVHDDEEEEEGVGRSSMNACAAAAAATQQNQRPRNREKRKRRKKGTRSLTFLLVIHFSPFSSSHGFFFSNFLTPVACRSSITGLIAKFGSFSHMLELMVLIWWFQKKKSLNYGYFLWAIFSPKTFPLYELQPPPPPPPLPFFLWESGKNYASKINKNFVVQLYVFQLILWWAKMEIMHAQV